ncbi:capsule biosynthesis protein CapK, partial [Acinetobacter baumannii]|nr:capsule biosynthesis protein CapK [Acinetobacter baumannii]
MAALDVSDEGPVLVGLSGRRPVRYFARGAWINNIDVTHALLPIPISHFNVHQRADASVVLRLAPDAMAHAQAALAALAPLFGQKGLTVEVLEADGKTLQY